MTRHKLLENFDNRDVALIKGELVIVLENERSGERGYAGDRYHGGPERAGGYHHVMVKTRHGRKVRVPRHVLSKEGVVFNCQLCYNPPLATYREYVDHMIDRHLRVQLLRGLDMSKKQPTCPFPSCHGMTWPIVDNLLYHYASHHNVLEKVVMYESEVVAEELRASVREKEATIETLVKEIGELKDAAVSTADEKEEGEVRDDNIQGAKEMREIMSQMKQEVVGLKLKIGNKNSLIKSLKDDLSEAKRSFKSCEKRYEDVVKYNLTIQTELNKSKSMNNQPPEVQGSSSSTPIQDEPDIDDVMPDTNNGKEMGENSVSSSGETFVSISKAVQSEHNPHANIAVLEELEDLRGKVERLIDQNEAWQTRNDSLQLEIENVHMQNENLKNIIEIGKSTVETAKKISQDLAEENKLMKQRESENSSDLTNFDSNLMKLKSENQNLMEKFTRSENQNKVENKNLLNKYNELQEKFKTQSADLAKLQDELNTKSAEAYHLHSELFSQVSAKDDKKMNNEKNLKLSAELKSLSMLKEDIKNKLIKCRENCRNVEESKRSLESDYKALILENRNAASEIKTLKNHLNSNRAIVVEKAVAKDEVNNLKTELASKSVEAEKSSIKLKKLSTELNCVLGELKIAKDYKNLVDIELKAIKEKVKKDSKKGDLVVKQNDLKELSEVKLKLKSKEEEFSEVSRENDVLKSSKKELEDRIEFYISQCTEFEKNDSKLQEEVFLLQASIKKSTVDNSVDVEKLRDTVQKLENSLVFYKDQEEVLIDENEKLKDTVANIKTNLSREDLNNDLVMKYNLKCDMVEELLKKHEKIAAQLRRKDWEIDNYQKKLDTAFEAGLLTLPLVHQLNHVADPSAVAEVRGPRSPECIALDLSNKEKVDHEDVVDEASRVEDIVAGPSGVESNCKRKFSECSSASQSHDDSNPISLHENMDASFDSTSTCPSEATKLMGAGMRRRSSSLGGPSPKKIPFVRLEDD